MDKKATIEARKKYSELIKKSKNQAKKNECLWCGKKTTKFCNSHSIPECILRNIDTDGKLDYYNAFLKLSLINEDKGVNEAGVFKLLCRECDGRIFQDYEDITRLEGNISEKMLEEIALKDILVMLYKRYYERELHKNIKRDFNLFYPYDLKQEVNVLDERDFWSEYLKVKEMIMNADNSKKFKLFYYQKLNYVVPIAFQGIVTLYGDLEGNIITDIYNKSKNVVVKHMHICIFPLKTCSVVFAFYHEDDIEYELFAKQFNELSEEEKINVISYIVYNYCEDMLFAKKFPHRTWILNKVRETFLNTTEIIAVDKEHAEYQKMIKRQELKNRDGNFPCILSKKFAIYK